MRSPVAKVPDNGRSGPFREQSASHDDLTVSRPGSESSNPPLPPPVSLIRTVLIGLTGWETSRSLTENPCERRCPPRSGARRQSAWRRTPVPVRVRRWVRTPEHDLVALDRLAHR